MKSAREPAERILLKSRGGIPLVLLIHAVPLDRALPTTCNPVQLTMWDVRVR